MRILLVEDEKPAMERMRKALHDFDASIEVIGSCGSVRDTVAWLESHAAPDLILMDVQLADGLSLEIARMVHIPCPVIFVTAYDDYVMQALERNGIDYILKPLRQERLATALRKFRMLRAQALGTLGSMREHTPAKPVRRLIGRKGNEFVPVDADEVEYAYSEHKLVFVVTRQKARLMLDASLHDLEAQLQPLGFFRLNRQYLAHPRAIRSFSSGGKGKIDVIFKADPSLAVTVSQERGQAFRQWLSGENPSETLETS